MNRISRDLYRDIVDTLKRHLTEPRSWVNWWYATFLGEDFFGEVLHNETSANDYAHKLVRTLVEHPQTKGGENSLICYLEYVGPQIGEYAEQDFNLLITRIQDEITSTASSLNTTSNLSSISTVTSDTDLPTLYRQALAYHKQSNYEQSLPLLRILKAQKYPASVLDRFIIEAEESIARQERHKVMVIKYDAIVALTENDHYLPSAQQEWYKFLKAYPNFRPEEGDDPAELRQKLRVQYLLA